MVQIDIAMPRDCIDCPFQKRFKDDSADDWYMRRCVIEGRIVEYPNKPLWCPLKEAKDITEPMRLIADNQGNALSFGCAPSEYERGLFDGLTIAYNILDEWNRG